MGPGNRPSQILHTNVLACTLDRSPQCCNPWQYKVITLGTDNHDRSKSKKPEYEVSRHVVKLKVYLCCVSVALSTPRPGNIRMARLTDS